MLLEHHYTEQMNFTWEKLWQSQMRLWGLRKDVAAIHSFAEKHRLEPQLNEKQRDHYLKIVNNNLDIPTLLDKFQSLISETLTFIQSKKDLNTKNWAIIKYLENNLLRLSLLPQIPENIIQTANERGQARHQKDFAKADQLRDKIHTQGYQIDDYPWGYGLWWRGEVGDNS
jgi:cysteinyl-tRNA synthetase